MDKELRMNCTALTYMERQLTDAARNGEAVVISVPWSDVKHTYTKALAARVMKAVARVLENERMNLLTSNKK